MTFLVGMTQIMTQNVTGLLHVAVIYYMTQKVKETFLVGLT